MQIKKRFLSLNDIKLNFILRIGSIAFYYDSSNIFNVVMLVVLLLRTKKNFIQFRNIRINIEMYMNNSDSTIRNDISGYENANIIMKFKLTASRTKLTP